MIEDVFYVYVQKALLLLFYFWWIVLSWLSHKANCGLFVQLLLAIFIENLGSFVYNIFDSFDCLKVYCVFEVNKTLFLIQV